MKNMYPAANTIIVQLLEDITAAVDEIAVTDASVFPAAPNFATIGTDNNAEVIVYQGIDLGNNKLTGCLRGQSYTVARTWAIGAFIYHSWTAQLANNMMENIDHLKENKADYITNTWTPVLSGNPSASLIRGNYTKIGNMVFVDFVANVDSFSGTGGIKVSGLPYSASELAVGAMSSLRYADDVAEAYPSIATGSESKVIAINKRVASHGGVGLLLVSDLLSTEQQLFRVSIAYRTTE